MNLGKNNHGFDGSHFTSGSISNSAYLFMQLTVLHEDVFSSRILGKFDGIVSNPPYIPTRELHLYSLKSGSLKLWRRNASTSNICIRC